MNYGDPATARKATHGRVLKLLIFVLVELVPVIVWWHRSCDCGCEVAIAVTLKRWTH
jgi:hypothetical protein